jgi:hypothetical protein
VSAPIGTGASSRRLALWFDGLFVAIQLCDALQGLGGLLRIILLGFDEVAAIVYPALGVGDVRLLLGISSIGRIAISEQGAAELVVQQLFNMGRSAAVGVGAHHFVGIAVERPEPAGFHLASLWADPALMAGLCGRLVSGLHSAALCVNLSMNQLILS